MDVNLVCLKCGCTHYTIKDAGKHKKAECAKCLAFIKFVKQWEDPFEVLMPFGKHKGEKLGNIPIDYLEWCSANVNLRGSLEEAIAMVLMLSEEKQNGKSREEQRSV